MVLDLNSQNFRILPFGVGTGMRIQKTCLIVVKDNPNDYQISFDLANEKGICRRIS